MTRGTSARMACHEQRCRAARGVTLVEAVLSLAILGIIMAAIGAATTVLMRLLPRADDPRTVAITAGSLFDHFDSDVASTLMVLEAESDLVRLLVAGLGDDGEPAAVVYRYHAGSTALTRAIGEEDARPMLAGMNAANFEFATLQRAAADPVAPEPYESDFGTSGVVCTESEHTLNSGQAFRQRLAPILDDDVSLWRIDSIQMRLKQHVIFGGGICRISFHYMNKDGTMNLTPFALRDVAISSLTHSTMPLAWQTFEFSDMPWISEDESIAVLLTAVGGSFRSNLASMLGHPSIELFDWDDESTIVFPGFLLCFRLSGVAMAAGESPDPVNLLTSITLGIDHPTLGQAVVHEARPPVPVLIEP